MCKDKTKRNARKTILLGVLLLALVGLLAAVICIPRGTEKRTSSVGPVQVYCTTYPLFVFARGVVAGSDGVAVRLLLPPDSGCPHDYALTPQDLMRLAAPDILLLKNGLGLDDALCEAARKANDSLTVVDTSHGVEGLIPYEETHEDHDGDHEDHDGDHHHGAHNPHVFASPATADDVVRNIRDALVRADPAHAGLYRKNAENILAQLGSLSDEFRAAVKSFPVKAIATQHDVFAYLARDFGLTEAVVLHADTKQSPSPADVTALSKAIRDGRIPVLFAEPQYPAKFALLIADEAGIPFAVLDPVATGPDDPPAGYYMKVMRKNLAILKQYLGASQK